MGSKRKPKGIKLGKKSPNKVKPGKLPSPEELKNAFTQAVQLHQAGKLDQAEQQYKALQVMLPNHDGLLTLMGILALQKQKPAQAVEYLQRSLEQNAENAKACDSLGAAYLMLNQPEQALSHTTQATRLQPNNSEYRFNLAVILKKLERTEEAVKQYQKAIRLQPKAANARTNLGAIYCERAEWDEAKEQLKAALEIRADLIPARLNLARAYFATDELDLASEEFEKVLTAQPENPDALLGLGRLAHGRGDHELALSYYNRVEQLAPEHPHVHGDRARTLLELNRLDEALQDSERALARSPETALLQLTHGAIELRLAHYGRSLEHVQKALELNNGLARAWWLSAFAMVKLGHYEEALPAYKQALKLDEESGPLHQEFAEFLMQDINKHEQAVQHLERAMQLGVPKMLALQSKLAEAQAYLCDWDAFENSCDTLIPAMEAKLDAGEPLGVALLVAMGFPISAGLLHRLAKSEARSIDKRRTAPRFTAVKHSHSRLRIGYVSPDFSSHALGFLLQDLFSHHDREKFEISAYSLRKRSDTFRATIEGSVDHFIDLTELSDLDAARRIHADEIDILIDLAGYTSGCRPGIFSYHPGAIQCAMLGYPGTLGSSAMEYVVTHSLAVPEELREHYSEKIVALPETLFATKGFTIPEQPPRRSDYGLPDSGVVFCCFNNTYRITREVFSVWMEILKQTPESVLWLNVRNEATRKRLLLAAKEQGVKKDRLVFANFKNMSDNWPHRLADLWLDTFVLSAGTATFLAAWAGLPVLTLAGNTPQSRTGASLVSACGLDDLVVDSIEAYRQRAIELGTQPQALHQYKAQLLERREQLPLFDPLRYIKHLEAAFRQMNEQFLSGEPVTDIDVKAV